MVDYRDLTPDEIGGLTQGGGSPLKMLNTKRPSNDPNGIEDPILSYYNYYDKVGCVRTNNLLDINRMLDFAKYKGGPIGDTVTGDDIEKIILPGGVGAITEVDDAIVAYRASVCPDEVSPVNCYHRAVALRVEEPYGRVIPNRPKPQPGNATFNADLEVGTQCVLIKNDPYAVGIMPIITKYNVYQQEVEIALLNSVIYNAVHKMLVAKDDKALQVVVNMLAQVRQGAPAAVVAKNISDIIPEIDLKDFGDLSNGILTNYRDIVQYFMSIKYNILGFDSNFNMKNEDLTANETELNEDLINNNPKLWMKTRKEFIAEYNKLYGDKYGEIEVEFGDSLDYLNPKALVMPSVEEETEEVTEEPVEAEEIITEEETEEVSEETPEEVVEAQEEPENEQSEEVTEEPETDAVEAIKEVVEDIKEIVEAVTDTEPEEKEEEEDVDDRTDNAELTE